MPAKLILYDRSRATADWTCPRMRYLNYELDGIGIVPEREPLELMMGSIIHESLAEIARRHSGLDPKESIFSPEMQRDYGIDNSTVDIDAIAAWANGKMHGYLLQSEKYTPEELLYADEQSALVEGMLRGFYKHAWPRLMAQFPKILVVEQEMSYTQDDVIFMCKPDLVAATPEGEVVYIEYKTTSSKREDWTNSWGTAIQLHATTRAIETALKEQISHVVIQGLYKGYESYGKQSSPFCYAYARSANPPFVKAEIAYEYKAGLKRVPVWELEGGVKLWVEKMPEVILANQFPCTPPIFVNNDMVDRFFTQRVYREREIELARQMLDIYAKDPAGMEGVLNSAFPQRFDQCQSVYGRPCAYQRICHGSVPEPLKNGFKPRDPHHAIDAESI